MLKKRTDFENVEDYAKYTESIDFLLQYSFKGKSLEEVIYDMALDVKGEETAAADVYAKLYKHGDNGDFTGLVFDIGLQNWEEQNEPDWDIPDDFIPLRRKEREGN